MGTRRGDHAQRFPQRAALGELDVDPVHTAREPRDVGGDEAAFIHDDGQMLLRRGAAHVAQAVQVVRGKRLLEEFDAVLLQDRDHLLCPRHGPARVGVHAEGLPRRVAHGAENLFVAVGAELYFQNGIVLGFAHFDPHLVRGIESDREGGERRALGIEPPETPQRLA